MDFWPIPNAVESIRFDCVIPQSDFSSDATELSIPEYPVILGAYTRALSERGDDGGVSFDEAVAAYNRALSDAIAQDASRVPDEMVWGVV